jgi:prepilin-type processing-associated H-X9-DG protein
MKLGYSNRRNDAMTLTEVLVVVVAILILAVMLLPPLAMAKKKSPQHVCVLNLEQIGIAFRIWEGDQDSRYPMQVSIEQNGAKELATAGNVAAVFQVMSNELSAPKVLICPADTNHIVAANWTTGFDSRNISYFVGLDATEYNQYQFLSGDDNVAIQGVAVKSGVVGLPTNQPVTWTTARHHFKGNILMVDGSVTLMDNSSLTKAITNQYTDASGFTNRFQIAIP